MIWKLIQKYLGIWALTGLIVTTAMFAFAVIVEAQNAPVNGGVTFLAAKRLGFSFLLFGVALLTELGWLALLAHRRFKRVEHAQSWLIDSVNWNIQRLKAHGLCKLPESSDEPVKGIETPFRWPWGGHHTEYLGHLEAAARKWWILYDSSDPTTAPTNEMVSDWLQSERNLSREKARAIASMLRPDGLPTGPRK
jgi:hypothetical protein